MTDFVRFPHHNYSQLLVLYGFLDVAQQNSIMRVLSQCSAPVNRMYNLRE